MDGQRQAGGQGTSKQTGRVGSGGADAMRPERESKQVNYLDGIGSVRARRRRRPARGRWHSLSSTPIHKRRRAHEYPAPVLRSLCCYLGSKGKSLLLPASAFCASPRRLERPSRSQAAVKPARIRSLSYDCRQQSLLPTSVFCHRHQPHRENCLYNTAHASIRI